MLIGQALGRIRGQVGTFFWELVDHCGDWNNIDKYLSLKSVILY